MFIYSFFVFVLAVFIENIFQSYLGQSSLHPPVHCDLLHICNRVQFICHSLRSLLAFLDLLAGLFWSFVYIKVHSCVMYSSMGFDKCIVIHHPVRYRVVVFPCARNHSFCQRSAWMLRSVFCPCGFAVSNMSYERNPTVRSLWVWTLLRSKMHWRFIHNVVWINSSCLLLSEYYSFVWMYPGLFICSHNKGYRCFQF